MSAPKLPDGHIPVNEYGIPYSALEIQVPPCNPPRASANSEAVALVRKLADALNAFPDLSAYDVGLIHEADAFLKRGAGK